MSLIKTLENCTIQEKKILTESGIYKLIFKSDKKEVSSFANFTQRKYDYDKLEKQLLGWVDDEEDYE